MSTTLSQCQQLVTAMAAVAANILDQELVIGKLVYREYHPEAAVAADEDAIATDSYSATAQSWQNTASNTAPSFPAWGMTDETGALPAYGPTGSGSVIVSAALAPVAQCLASPASLNGITRMMARALAYNVEYDLCGASALFSLSAVGTYGTAITDANILLAAQELDASNISPIEQRYLVLKVAGATAGSSNGNTWDNFLALTNVVNPAVMGTPTVEANYLNRAPISYRGFHVLPFRGILAAGSSPVNFKNVAFTSTCLGLAIGQQTPVNDSTHVQAVSLSSGGDMAVQVRLDFDGSSASQWVELRLVYSTGINRPSYGLLFKT